MATVAFDSSEDANAILGNHYALELAYVKSLRQTDAVYDEERVRQLRMQILILEDEKDSLHEQLAQDDDRIDELEQNSEEYREQLDTARTSLETAQSELRLKTREIETLRVELRSLHEATMDSTKLLTEKLTLARELSTLKPEIDHLRSQAASNQSLLSEKLSLQRQLSALQVELELEKRTTQRAMAKEGKFQAEGTKTATQLENLQAEFAKERRERQRVERESQKASSDWETKRTTLESRLDAFRTKLKSTKDQLQETQTELQAARSASHADAGRSNPNNFTKNAGKDARKRIASRMDDDTMIGTPGDSRPAKKTKRGSVLPGDKSTFSITPFLNRATSVALESPSQESDGPNTERDADAGDATEPEAGKGNEGPASSSIAQSPTRKHKATTSQKATVKPSILDNARPGKTNLKAPQGRKPKPAPVLEQVAEETNDENAAPIVKQLKVSATEASVGNDTEKGEVKKRKRKLLGGGLGKTLFDDDEAETVQGDRRTNGGSRAAGTLGRVTLGAPNAGPRLGLSGGMSGFGNFSPLKKDRKTNGL
ncbi:MAG: hypothetical protein Q9191_002704 [Dirinaria sp. TL-2023a]